jgi:hypothetical protein
LGFIGGAIRVYDSLMSSQPSQDLKKQLNQLYSPPDDSNVAFTGIEFQQQVGSSDCGLFTIGFAVDLLEGNDITKIVYDQSQMRTHLIKCLKDNKLTPFPRNRVTH